MTISLSATARAVFGKKAKSLRAEGRIPAELYGHNLENRHLSVGVKEFAQIFREAGESAVIQLREGDKTYPVLIQETDIHPITGEIRNIDFYQIDMNKKLELSIPVRFVGDTPAVKQGGVLVKAVHEIEVRCLPANIPHTIAVDLSVLKEIDQAIAVKDIPAMQGVEFLLDPETVIAVVNQPEEEPIEEEKPADVAAITTEGEEKRKQETTKKEEEKKIADETKK